MSNLKNRFPKNIRYVWEDWHSCLVCNANKWDALHHIISPSSMLFVPGDHNKSIYNSCPIHNFKCHIDNESLSKKKTIKRLLKKNSTALRFLGYKPETEKQKERDREFKKVYNDLLT